MWEYYIHFNYSLNPLSFYIWQPFPSCRVCRHQLPFNQISWAVRQGSSWLLLLLVLQPGLLFCWDQWAWADNTLSNSSWGTGSPLLCCGEILAVCTNVFHLSYVTGKVYTKPESAEIQIYCVSIHTHTMTTLRKNSRTPAPVSLLSNQIIRHKKMKGKLPTFKSTYVRCFAFSKARSLTSRHLQNVTDHTSKEPRDSFLCFFLNGGNVSIKSPN